MAEVDLKLAQREESLWRRGQAEIAKIQQEESRINMRLERLQQRQSSFAQDTTLLRNDVNSLIERVGDLVKEMHAIVKEASPAPSVASTAASSPDEHAPPHAEWEHRTPKRCVNSPPVISLASTVPKSAPGVPLRLSESLEPSAPRTPRDPQPRDLALFELVKEQGFKTLGMEVQQHGPCLRVQVVDNHGLVKDYNDLQDHDATKLQTDDCIVEVNGIRDPKKMVEECKEAQRVRLLVKKNTSGRLSELLVDRQAHSEPVRMRAGAPSFIPNTDHQLYHPPGLPLPYEEPYDSLLCSPSTMRPYAYDGMLRRTLFS